MIATCGFTTARTKFSGTIATDCTDSAWEPWGPIAWTEPDPPKEIIVVIVYREVAVDTEEAIDSEREPLVLVIRCVVRPTPYVFVEHVASRDLDLEPCQLARPPPGVRPAVGGHLPLNRTSGGLLISGLGTTNPGRFRDVRSDCVHNRLYRRSDWHR